MSDIIGSDLRKFVAPEFIFGIGARKLVGRYANNLGIKRVLVVSDEDVIKAGWTQDVEIVLQELDVTPFIFSNVSPNPRDFQVMDGVSFYHENKCDGIIAIGGGSPMDLAKGVAIVVGNGGKILEYEGVDTINEPGPPLICIPTTSGTAADVSQFAIITDVENKNKIAIISKAIVPDVALIDPETTVTMDPKLTACTGLDALTHAIEAFVSNAHSPITDNHALIAIDLVKEWLPKVINSPDDLVAREKMSLASLEAGLAFSNASLGAVHAMAHSLGGFLDLPHGECNSILLNHVLAYNSSACVDRLITIGHFFSLQLEKKSTERIKQEIIDTFYKFRSSLGIQHSLGDIGVNVSDIPELSKHAIVDPCLLTNPRKVSQRDIEVIYEEAL